MNVAPSLFLAASLAAFLAGRSATPEISSQVAAPAPPPRVPGVPDVQLDIAEARQLFVAAHVRSPEPPPDLSSPPPMPAPPPPPATQPPPRPRPPTPAEVAAGFGRDVSAVIYGASGPELLMVDQRSNARRTLQPGSVYGSGWRFAGVDGGYLVLRKGAAIQRVAIGSSGSNAATIDLPAAPPPGPATTMTEESGPQLDIGAEPPRRRMLRRGNAARKAVRP